MIMRTFASTLISKFAVFTFFLAVAVSSQFASIGDELTKDISFIVSRSHNLTVQPNHTVVLPCVVRKTSNTIVIWNQCEDPDCNELRNLLTIDKENFIQDLRIRVLSEPLNLTKLGQSSSEHVDEPSPFQINELLLKNATEADKSSLVTWNLEIRKFGKSDIGCYQCQLNSMQQNVVHYCLKMEAKVTAKPKKITVRLNEPLKLRCFSDEIVHTNTIRWYKNGHRLADEGHHAKNEGAEHGHNKSNALIEKKLLNDQVFTSLYIRQAGMNDAGVYLCKFGHMQDKIFVDVIINDSGLKYKSSAEIRSNDESQPSQLDFLNSATTRSSVVSILFVSSVAIFVLLCSQK